MGNRSCAIRYLILTGIISLLGACSGSGSGDPDAIRYRVTFSEAWDATNFPTQFPPNSHFSSLIGAVHGPGVDFFELNQGASSGVESMAETGSTFGLRTEVKTAIAAGNALQVISGGGISNANTSVSSEFTVSVAFPLVSLFSMVAPSPDWFVAVDGVDLGDRNGGFVDSLTVDLVVYDSGTDDGVSFTSANSNSSTVITRLSCVDPVNHCGFDEGKGTNSVEFIGSFSFVRIQ
ncbi:MAG: hypothetical protein ACI87H_003498 [Gammaproteobacteria bacterium]|jgi:hypothetical protein